MCCNYAALDYGGVVVPPEQTYALAVYGIWMTTVASSSAGYWLPLSSIALERFCWMLPLASADNTTGFALLLVATGHRHVTGVWERPTWMPASGPSAGSYLTSAYTQTALHHSGCSLDSRCCRTLLTYTPTVPRASPHPARPVSLSKWLAVVFSRDCFPLSRCFSSTHTFHKSIESTWVAFLLNYFSIFSVVVFLYK